MLCVAWQWVSISWNSVVTTVTNAECQNASMPARGMAVDVHVPGITVTNARNAAHGNDGRLVPGIVQPQQSQTQRDNSTISIYYNSPSNLAIQIHFLEFL